MWRLKNYDNNHGVYLDLKKKLMRRIGIAKKKKSDDKNKTDQIVRLLSQKKCAFLELLYLIAIK